jgi:Polysaccharide deacetylase
MERSMTSTIQTAVPRISRTLVLLDDTTVAALPESVAALERAGAHIKVVNYRGLMSEVEQLRRFVSERQIEFVLFSRNDQIHDKVSIGPMIRALRIGYSSFSGIDSSDALEQTRTCLDDFLKGVSKLDCSQRPRAVHAATRQAGTFSLIFDLEQLGGARYGLPRILDLLDEYGAIATFFVTNFIPAVYTNVLDLLVSRGHEVGLHGLYHEYLSGRPLHRQIAMIRRMKSDLGTAVSISGANFLGRMDANTIKALIKNDLNYFVVFMEHRYSPLAYRKMPVRPLLVWSQSGMIWMVPVSVETNNRPWFSVKNTVDSVIIANRTDHWHHVNILLHPFRDGSLRHIGDLKRLLNYMRGTLAYEGVPVCDAVRQLPQYEPSSLIYSGLDDAPSKTINQRFWHSWWHNTPRYQRRIYNLYQALARNERRPALCLDAAVEGEVFAVYPHLPEESGQLKYVHQDPLLMTSNASTISLVGRNGHGSSVCAFVPTGYQMDFKSAVHTLRPRFQQDYTGLLPELALRAGYRLSAGRHIF